MVVQLVLAVVFALAVSCAGPRRTSPGTTNHLFTRMDGLSDLRQLQRVAQEHEVVSGPGSCQSVGQGELVLLRR